MYYIFFITVILAIIVVFLALILRRQHYRYYEDNKTIAANFQELSKDLKEVQENYINKTNEIKEDFEKTKRQYDEQKEQLAQEYQRDQDELKKLEETLQAGVRIQVEKIKEDDFYNLVPPKDEDLEDIEKLEKIRTSLHNPSILSKIIWSTYFQKEANELCARVLGNNIVCGIYKIASLVTGQVYIGQSKDIAKRFKQHIKCGLGIDTPSTNKLYKAMLDQGVWNFSFELLEECNEKEASWIKMFDSNHLGYNTTMGVANGV